MTGESFSPIGGPDDPFEGRFDGGGWVIEGVELDTPLAENVGLFGRIDSGGVILNVHIQGANITGENMIGILAGQNDGTIEYSSTDGEVGGDGNFAGGLVGRLSDHGSISNSYSMAAVEGNEHIGGLVGHAEVETTILHSYSISIVTGEEHLGTLIGSGSGDVRNSYWNEETNGTMGSAGGTPLTSDQFENEASFVDWDFDEVWEMSDTEKRPILQSEPH